MGKLKLLQLAKTIQAGRLNIKILIWSFASVYRDRFFNKNKGAKMYLVRYTLGWETRVKYENRVKTFSSVESFYSYMQGHGIKYLNNSSYSDPKVIIYSLGDIEKLFS